MKGLNVRKGRGRPVRDFVDEAVDIIQTGDEPISTKSLVDLLNLSKNDAMILRRGLRRAQERGQIREVAQCSDGSLSWIGGEQSLARCAGHAANLFLDRESPGDRIDTEKFEESLTCCF